MNIQHGTKNLHNINLLHVIYIHDITHLYLDLTEKMRQVKKIHRKRVKMVNE